MSNAIGDIIVSNEKPLDLMEGHTIVTVISEGPGHPAHVGCGISTGIQEYIHVPNVLSPPPGGGGVAVDNVPGEQRFALTSQISTLVNLDWSCLMKTLRLGTCILGVFIVLVYIGLAQAGSITFDDLRKNKKINGMDFDGDVFSGKRALLVYGKGSEHIFSVAGKDKSFSPTGKNKFFSPTGKNDSFRLDFQDGITSIDFDMLAGRKKALDFEAKFYDENGNLIGDIDDFSKRDKTGFWHFSFAADTPIAYMIFSDHNRRLDLGFDNFRFGQLNPPAPVPEPSAPVPEPSTLLLLGSGLGVLGLYGHRLRRTKS